MSGWTAVLLAGSRPSADPLAEAFGAPLKALIPVAGEPMVLRPLRALLGHPRIAKVIVLTQHPEVFGPVMPSDERLEARVSKGTIAETVAAVLADPSTRFPVLVTTADHALLDDGMLSEFIDGAKGRDLAIGAVERGSLLTRFPDARRTWIPFRGGQYSGANLFAFGSDRALHAVGLWQSAEQARKSRWRLFRIFGPALLVGALLRLRTLDQTVATVGRKLGIDFRAVVLSDPLAAVDVDKVDDHALVEAIIAGRA